MSSEVRASKVHRARKQITQDQNGRRSLRRVDGSGESAGGPEASQAQPEPCKREMVEWLGQHFPVGSAVQGGRLDKIQGTGQEAGPTTR